MLGIDMTDTTTQQADKNEALVSWARDAGYQSLTDVPNLRIDELKIEEVLEDEIAHRVRRLASIW
jgi:hypothetical protein